MVGKSLRQSQKFLSCVVVSRAAQQQVLWGLCEVVLIAGGVGAETPGELRRPMPGKLTTAILRCQELELYSCLRHFIRL